MDLEPFADILGYLESRTRFDDPKITLEFVKRAIYFYVYGNPKQLPEFRRLIQQCKEQYSGVVFMTGGEGDRPLHFETQEEPILGSSPDSKDAHSQT